MHSDNPKNAEGGLYGALFENSELKGGLHFEASGDSIVVRGNIISGSGIGIYAALVKGASLLTIEDNQYHLRKWSDQDRQRQSASNP
jgi:hypothetical protein